MAKTSKNILDEARSTIKQIGIDEARGMIDKPGTVLVDVRESDEWRQGHIPQAVAIPRGFLELRIEEKVPDHKTPAIAGAAVGAVSGLKIDLTRLFGGGDALTMAAAERDRELVADGRDAVGLTVGIPKRQVNKVEQPKDELDKLTDALDALDI